MSSKRRGCPTGPAGTRGPIGLPVRYGLVMIVRDEAAVIDRVLDSAGGYITAATIMDTGSTDGTQAKIEAHGWEAQPLEWVNFGQARSAAFAAARGTADWLLALDADMTVEIDPDWEPDPDVDAYMLEMGDGLTWSNRLPLLLRGDREWVSVGAVHEYTVLASGDAGRREVTDRVRIVNHGTQRQDDPARARKYAALLRTALEQNPDDPRTVFYLAQTERELGHVAKAKRLYKRRAAMVVHEEERWYAQFRAALLEPWPTQLVALLTAWERRWHRLEPLYHLLRALNAHDLHAAAYQLAVPQPSSPDTLLVDAWVWDWGIIYERSIAAWWIPSQRHVFEELTAQLLANPRLPAHIRAQVASNAALEAAS